MELLAKKAFVEGKTRQELIREIDLGPFRHKVDDGLPLRKMAYTVVLDLISTFPEKLVGLYQDGSLVDFVVQGIQDAELHVGWGVVCGLGDRFVSPVKGLWRL